ncbi:hypothetical protein F383_36907 [Gossypium arboreum]|uniref:Uncharacterized protein n=1 Tax=Gossypium arboreum TaxID=29729 RepID=A0A0B0NE82_GOSAR|nr:hypothetical protein F383_36907 [Gossypium arboreum]
MKALVDTLERHGRVICRVIFSIWSVLSIFGSF